MLQNRTSSGWTQWVCTLALIPLSFSAHAAVIDVTSADDDTALQTALDQANGNSDAGNTITFTIMEVDPTIELDSSLTVEAGSTLILDGTGDGLTIDGDNLGADPLLEVGEHTEIIDIELTNGSIDIGAGKNLTLTTPTTNRTSTVDFVGGGNLIKQGAGILFLTGDLDHTGTTTVSEGTLGLDRVATIGDVVNNGELRIDLDAEEGTYSGVVSGTGSLTKTGAFNLILNGLNTHTGGTLVNQGTLTLLLVDDGGTDRFSIQGDVTIETNGTIAFVTNGGSTTFAGKLSGAGDLEKLGTGRLILTGANTNTGSIALDVGELEGTSRSISGDVVVANGTELIFAQDFDGTYGGDVSSPGNAGAIVKEGTGNLRLAGDNSAFLGALRVNAGRVTGNAASLPRSIQNDGTVVFDEAAGATYTGLISNGITAQPGAVQKTGSGTLTFTNNHTYTGPTTIAGGRLDVDGTLASPTTVNGGATLGGIGTITAPIDVSGTVAPGKSIGTLRVDSATFNAGSVLEIEIESGSIRDVLVVNGPLAVGDDVRIVPRFANLASDVNALVVTSLGRTGQDFEIGGDFAFQEVLPVPEGNNFRIQINLGQVSAGAQTSNQTAIATALANADTDGVVNELDAAVATLVSSSLTSAEGARALDEIGGEALSQFNTARLSLARRVGDNAQGRVRTVFAGGASPLFGSIQPATPLIAGVPARASGSRPGASLPRFDARTRGANITTRGSLRSFEPEVGTHGFGGWLDGYGGFGSIDGDRNAADADYILAGATLGFDYRITPNVLAGIGGGWGFTDLDVDDRSADGDANTYHGLVYGGYATPQFHFGLSGHYAFSEIETTRKIVYSTVAQTADGDFEGVGYGVRVEGGVNIAQLYGVMFQPIAHFDWTRIDQDGFRETGSPAFNLDVGSESIDSEITSVGLRLHGAWALPDEGASFEPELIARWEHQFGDDERDITSTLIGDGTGTPIALRGADAPTDRYVVHLGWVVSSAIGLRTSLGYTGGFSNEQMEHAGTLTLQYDW